MDWEIKGLLSTTIASGVSYQEWNIEPIFRVCRSLKSSTKPVTAVRNTSKDMINNIEEAYAEPCWQEVLWFVDVKELM